MDYNYHTHTFRCNHASGTPEDYVLRAIDCGIKYMGFSDHIPLKFPDGTESGYRVLFEQGKVYCDEIKNLADKYRDKIDINVGFEAEYYPEYFDTMLKNAVGFGAEYLILGQHFVAPENTNSAHVVIGNTNPEDIKKYAQTVVSAIKTGAFTYVAHPDVFNFTGDKEIYRQEMRKICIASRETGIPLEINFLGIRDGRHYPNVTFWEVAGEEGAPVTFGMDAHDTANAFDGESLKKAMEMVDKYNLNYIGRPRLIRIDKK